MEPNWIIDMRATVVNMRNIVPHLAAPMILLRPDLFDQFGGKKHVLQEITV
jgi:hypothetical protein